MDPVIRRRWEARGTEPEFAGLERISRQLGISPLAARVLWLRGISTPGTARGYLECRLADLPDPFLLKGMDRAVERLVRAVVAGERIAVHGDYDVDGITGTALLVESLQALGGEVEYHIPLRLRDGYGLSAEALERAAASGARVALSVDCGVSACAEARRAAELGLDLVITDHHQPPDSLPEAFAIINPHLPGCRFPFKSLAGVGVAFFLLIALRKALREAGHFENHPEPDLRRSLDLVALGTIADIVPLQGVNRTLTRYGLEALNRGGRPGIQALKEVAAVDQVNCGNVAFRLAPRLNAAGRLEDAALGVELLLAGSQNEARPVAQMLDGFNRERQEIEQETLGQALELLEGRQTGGAKSIVLADERWHPGVIGIVASRLVERYHRPCVLIALENGQGKGSGRSIPGFHLYRALQHSQEHLAGFGGHEYAAGLSILGPDVEPFAARFEEFAQNSLGEQELLPCLAHDGEALVEELTFETVEQLGGFAPFGAGNPEPTFVLRGVRAQQAQVVGNAHLRFVARQGGYTLPGIGFGLGSRLSELAGEVDLLVAPGLNDWQGRVSVQLRVKDLRPATGGG
ncbi:single-stranded-DNA-specific exonuclease RecJ [Desulfuromonas versatilis]|uniref:Single-stranded-DNA-specific exonuclease RecJ n=1 Tax=Desulfuromonas versatilis TaxID=2802975 RepID=A0ABM8HWC2_9BACT|nr:single-stranded-DNA-specific exonuclease RecJ [Desulfuromonas versatilis]BCR05428.1 single-stranded-DNA-specific exonuclease RecJ [Desulfuromonas versatilis]